MLMLMICREGFDSWNVDHVQFCFLYGILAALDGVWITGVLGRGTVNGWLSLLQINIPIF